MTATNTTVMKSVDHYARLRALAKSAGVSVKALATEAGLNPMTLYTQGFVIDGGLRWKTSTINNISTALAPRLGMRPSEVSAILTGLEDMPARLRSK